MRDSFFSYLYVNAALFFAVLLMFNMRSMEEGFPYAVMVMSFLGLLHLEQIRLQVAEPSQKHEVQIRGTNSVTLQDN